ncbi:hypothetical protein GGR51DRAFT_332942, partial [Nemania sp. FL0031]
SNIKNYPGRIAIIYTYLPGVKSSCGIFFGCEKDDVETVYSMLKRSRLAYADPLLLPAAFAELQTSRVEELGDILIDEALTVNGYIGIHRSRQKYFQPPHLTERVSDMITDVKIFEEDVAGARRQLQGLINCTPRSGGSSRNKNYMLRKRLEQMSCQYDDISGACRVSSEMASLSAETHATTISKHIAIGSMVLAFIAILYLPISTIASIFSMPIFDFKADWKDIYGRPTPKVPDPTREHPFVVSYYLTYYLAISLTLLLLTLEGWHIFTRKDDFEWRQVWKFLLTTRFLVKLFLTPWGLMRQFIETLKYYCEELRHGWGLLGNSWIGRMIKRGWKHLKRLRPKKSELPIHR